MANKRKSRDKTDNVDLMKPVDITQFGTDNDPCFGKHYNLNTSECKRCGDSELCGIVTGQNLHLKRDNIEKDVRFKDMEITKEPNHNLERWVIEKHKEGLSRSSVITKAKNTFGTTRLEIKEIYKKLKLK